jgi:predicted metal-dependent peptidase
MKNYLPIFLLFSAGAFIFNSCATLSTAYVDDVYYNPATAVNTPTENMHTSNERMVD